MHRLTVSYATFANCPKFSRIYANLDTETKLIVHNPRMRNELRYYEPKMVQK